MLERGQRARQLQHHQMAHHIRLDIGVGIDQRIAHAGLGGQMHDAGDAGKFLCQCQHARRGSEMSSLRKVKALSACQPRQPRLFQCDVVIILILSTPSTASPRARSAFATCDPIKPAAPVTRIMGAGSCACVGPADADITEARLRHLRGAVDVAQIHHQRLLQSGFSPCSGPARGTRSIR